MGFCGGFGRGSCGEVGAAWGGREMCAVMYERTRICCEGIATLEVLLGKGCKPRER